MNPNTETAQSINEPQPSQQHSQEPDRNQAPFQTMNIDQIKVTEFSGDSLNLAPCTLPPEYKSEVSSYAQSLSLSELSSINELGLDVQRNIGEVTSKALDNIRLADAGQAGEIIQGLIESMQELRPQDLRTQPGSWLQRQVAHVPVVGKHLAPEMHGVVRFIQGFETTEASMASIVDTLEREVVKQKEHAGRLKQIRTELGQYVDEMGAIIEAGKERLKSEKERFNPLVREFNKNANPDRRDVLALLEEFDKLEALDQRLDNLNSARNEAILSAANIYTVERDCLSIEGLVNDSVTFMTSAWRRHVVLAISLHDQDIALKLVNAINDTTAKFIGTNSEALKRVHVEVSRKRAEGFACVDDLVKATNDWVDTLKKGREATEEGTAKRKEAVTQMQKAQEKVVETFTELQGLRLKDALKSADTSAEKSAHRPGRFISSTRK